MGHARDKDIADRDPRSDQQLIAALNAGDGRAFEPLYFRYRDWVVRLAVRFTGHDDDALDVLQETFSYLFRKFPGFVLTAGMTTFLYPVVKNLSIAARRKRTRQVHAGETSTLESLAGPAAVGYDPTSASGTRSELSQVLERLPEGQREVLLLRFIDDFSLAEIGAALGIPEGTVKSRLHNALAALRADPKTKAYFE